MCTGRIDSSNPGQSIPKQNYSVYGKLMNQAEFWQVFAKSRIRSELNNNGRKDLQQV